ncbi:centromere protein J isoform X2 [Boleophthalmus pectinirostris]|uniref:centromere protein J isoform X2 n=1 Tax=Boleophthalmus pectinirostris TaxID=150288 RepID=UPI000A1C3ADC|nr:centromere protein J isoform X2 [Boleophthalmus pectinirostris]
MSFPALRCSQADLWARWVPGSSRAGALPEGPACSASPGPDDSFSGHFAPLLASADSSCVVPEPLSFHTDMELKQAGHEQQREATDDEEAAQPHNVPLVLKLEQLRQWQEHMQQQLRAQQLQELLHLQQEQHRLLALMSSPSHHSEDVEELSGADWEEATLHSRTECHLHNMEGQGPRSQRSPQSQSPQSQSPQTPLRFPSPYQEEEQPLTQGSGSRLSSQHQEPEDSSTHWHTPAADRPIRPGTGAQRTFEDLLEEQLRHEEKRLKSVHPPQSDPGGCAPQALPKRAFLRRGEGLLRFTGHKADICKNNRPPAQTEAIIRSSSEPVSVQSGQSSYGPKPLQRKTATVSQEPRPTTSLLQDTKAARLKGLQSQLQLHQPPPQTVQRQTQGPASTRPTESAACGSLASEARPQADSAHHRAEAWPTEQGRGKGLTQGLGQGQGLGQEQEQGGARSSQERSFQERLLRWEKVRQEESVELGEFELLEQAAEELSFSSNSSFVLKVLQMDRQKQLPAEELHQRRLSSTPVKSPPHPVSRQGPTEGGPQQSARQGLCETSSDSWKRRDDPAEQQVPSGPCVYAFPCQSNPPYDKHTYQDQHHSPTPGEEANSDGEDCTVTEHLPEEHPSEEHCQEKAEEQTSRVLFDDHDTWSQLSEDHSLSTDSPGEPSSPPEHTVEQEAQPSQLMSRLFPALKTHSHNAPVCAPPTAKPQSAPTITHPQQAQSLLLRERLAELEVEIQRFKKENASLAKLRKDNLRVQEELRRERSDFEQMMVQERSRLEEYKREESRKLQRERRLWEKHMTAARAAPNKSERDEIQALKQQLSSVQEELRRKESRWANTHSRLRHQLEALGQDNRGLRDEVKTLEKLRITAWKKNSMDSDKPSAVKGVKFATPLDSSSTNHNSPPAAATRWSRRASAPGGMVGTKGFKSSLRRPSLTVTTVEETGHGDENQSSWSPEEAHAGSSSDTQAEVNPAQDYERRKQEPQEEVLGLDGKVEQVLSNGARLIVFPNGTKKEVSPDGQTVKVTFFNGDTKELTADQRVIYFYAEAKTTHITYPDGMEVLLFPNKQTEKHFPDGRKEITFPDQTVKNLYPNGREESVLTDGTVIQIHPDGSKEIHFNTGQREVHTAEYKRREYPDGTVKTVYSDGRQETCYPTGRLRVKDKDGNIILDTP